jgi:hypothetical protein
MYPVGLGANLVLTISFSFVFVVRKILFYSTIIKFKKILRPVIAHRKINIFFVSFDVCLCYFIIVVFSRHADRHDVL